jgi:2-amino-4-hydroxy-6-hydroxymethyldihydropteridine diphosphokinase
VHLAQVNPPETLFLGLGGNLGPVIATMRSAIALLDQHAHLERVSRIYLTRPVSDLPQPPYLNAACKLKTALDPLSLLTWLEEIERSLGKKRKAKNAPRTIDIDILFHGDRTLSLNRLQIPHSAWSQRAFVLLPLYDLTSEIAVGKTRHPLAPLIDQLPPDQLQGVEPISEKLF